MKIQITFSDGREPITREVDDSLGVLVVSGEDFAGEWLDWETLVKDTATKPLNELLKGVRQIN